MTLELSSTQLGLFFFCRVTQNKCYLPIQNRRGLDLYILHLLFVQFLRRQMTKTMRRTNSKAFRRGAESRDSSRGEEENIDVKIWTSMFSTPIVIAGFDFGNPEVLSQFVGSATADHSLEMRRIFFVPVVHMIGVPHQARSSRAASSS